MRDYRKSRFWSMLRKIGIYPHDVRVWKSKMVVAFHRATFSFFLDKKKLERDLNELVGHLKAQDEILEQIESSL